TMLAVAAEGVSVASNGGGETCVHTQLYGLHQRRLERTLPPPPAPPERLAGAATQALAVEPSAAVDDLDPGAPAHAGPDIDAIARAAAEEQVARRLSESLRREDGASEPSWDELAREMVRGAIDHALEQQSRLHREQIQCYERRLAKLTRTLETT